MPYFIAEVSETPLPQAGERVAQLRMTSDPEKGWRLSARSIETGRRLGGWVSNCPRSIADAAYLWLISYNWTLQNAPDSQVDVQRALGQAPAPTPAGVTAIMAIDLLRRNFVPEGQQVPGVAGEESAEESYPGFLPTPGGPLPAPGRATPRPRPQPLLTGPVAGRAQPPTPRKQPQAQALEPVEDPVENAENFLKTLLGELKKGADPQALLPYIAQFFELETEPAEEIAPAELRGLLLDGLRALRAGESPEEIGLRFEEFFGLGGEAGGDEEFDEGAEEEPVDDVAAPAPTVRRMRPLLPDEPAPAGMDLPPESPRDRAKMERTFRRTTEVHMRAEQQISRAAAAGVKIEHPDQTAARVAEAQAARPRRLPAPAPAVPVAPTVQAEPVEAAPTNGAVVAPKPPRKPRRAPAVPETPEG